MELECDICKILYDEDEGMSLQFNFVGEYQCVNIDKVYFLCSQFCKDKFYSKIEDIRNIYDEWIAYKNEPDIPAIFTPYEYDSDIVILQYIKSLSKKQFNAFTGQVITLMHNTNWCIKYDFDKKAFNWTWDPELLKKHIDIGQNKLELGPWNEITYPLPIIVWDWLIESGKVKKKEDDLL